MGFRKCDKHGWLATSEYTVNEVGTTVCPVCEVSLSGFRMDVPPGPPAKETYPRKKFDKARQEYTEERDM